MLAIGLFSLLGLSFATMLSNDEDIDALLSEPEADDIDEVSPVNNDLTNDLTIDLPPLFDDDPVEEADDASGTSEPSDLEEDFPPTGESDADIEGEIEDFLEDLLAEDPDRPFDETVQELEDFIDGLENQDPPVDPEIVQTGNSNEAASVDRPPMGDDFNDPLQMAEELEEQLILDEIAAEEAREPVNLVTVSDADGAEIDDALVMQETEEGSGHFVVTAPEDMHDISVGYDAASTFEIRYSAETTSIIAGLNSDIEGPAGTMVQSVGTDVDPSGETVDVVTFSPEYDHSTDITLQVDEADIGTHFARIDLTNPNDTLHFDFAEDVTGNLHFIYSEVEEGVAGATSTTLRAFVIRTPEDVTSLSADDVAALLAEDNGQNGDSGILAEVYLGEDTLFVNSAQSADEAGEIRIIDLINDAPLISSNIAWASTASVEDSQIAGEDSTTGTTGGEEDDTGLTGGMQPGDEEEESDEDEIRELFEDIGINPDFFGF